MCVTRMLRARQFILCIGILFIALASRTQEFDSQEKADQMLDQEFGTLDSSVPPPTEPLSAVPEAPAEQGQFEEVSPVDPVPAPIAEDPVPEPLPPEPVIEEFQTELAPAEPENNFSSPDLNASVTGDEPDLSKENKLHSIYLKYNQIPMPESQWDGIIKDRKSENYSIQRGDTLWSISEVLFGDGAYWPKVWSLNSSITNPHEIKPQNTIRFFSGSFEQAPAVTITDEQILAEKESELMSNTEPIILKSSAGEFEIPPNQSIQRPVIKNLPSSLPSWSMVSKTQKSPDIKLETMVRRFNEPVAPLTHYVSEELPVSMGEIIEPEKTMAMAAKGENVYIKSEQSLGGNYLIYKVSGEVKSSNTGKEAHIIENIGELRILGLQDSENKIYKAEVIKSVLPISTGAQITNGAIAYYQVNPRSSSVSFESNVIGGVYDEGANLFGQGQLIYLDRGINSGLQEGTHLSVYGSKRLRYNESKVGDLAKAVGTIQVIRVTPEFATAVVVNSVDEIRRGDKTGQSLSMNIQNTFEYENEEAFGVDPGF